MAVKNVYTDTNYSSLPSFLDNDTIYVDYLATLTITTDTSAIGGISFGGNGSGKVVINNTSTTTPIFIKVSGSITLTRDAIFESNGNVIEIGTGDGSTTTYNLPTGAGSAKYSDLGACWVDKGATFRDGTSYKTTYAQVSSLSNKLSAYTFGDVFSQDTTANTITFLKPVPSGCKVYVPNIQIIGTHVSNSAFSNAGRINLNYTSLSKIVNIYLNGAVDFKLNYCGLGFCQTTSFSNSRRMAGGVTILNTGFNWSYYWDIYGSAIGAVIKNVYYVSNLHAGSIYPTAQGPGLYIEKYTSIFDKDDCGDPTSGNSNNILLQISCPAGKVYDVYLGSASQVFSINTTGTTYDNIVIVPTGNIVSFFSRLISNVTNNGSGLIRITTSANIIVSTNQIVKITGVGGVTNANGTWRVNQISNTQFDLLGSSFSGTYTAATGIVNSYASNNRSLFYVTDNATKNVLTNISILPAYDVPVDPTHGTLHRGIYTFFSNTGNNYNTFTNCTFSLQTNYGIAPMLVERGTYNTYNKVTVTDSTGTTYAQKTFLLDQESYGIVVANWTNLSASQVSNLGGIYTYFGSRIERVLLDEDTPATDFGYNFTYTGIDSPSVLAFTNINKTTGRVFALNSLSASILSMVPSPLNTGPYTVKESKLYIRNTGDSVAYETSIYGGITGIDSFCARDDSMGTVQAKDFASTIDTPYQYALSMRRPDGAYTTPVLVYGSRLTGGASQVANYNVGNTVAQTIATGLTAFGTVDFINSSELRICNITTLSSTPNPNYLWGHFLDNVTTSGLSGTAQGIRNITTGYVPPSNVFTNQYEYIPSKTINTLNNALTSLPTETRIKNQVQFKVHVIRDIKDYYSSTYDQRFFGAAIDVKLDPNYIAPVSDLTYLNLTLNGGYVSIYDDIGELKYYTNQNQLIKLPLDSVGTWTYKYAKYGYKLGQGQFSIDQKTNEIAPIVSPDFYLTELSVSLVSAYNTFSTTQNIYDYLSFYRTTSAGLAYGDLNQYSSTLDISSYRLILSDTVTPAFSFDGSKFIIKSSSIQGRDITTTGGIVLSGSNTFSNITLNANVSSNVVNSLNTVNVNGILTYNTNTPANIIYTNTSVLTARNYGTGTINIKRINSTITDATDAEIQNYAPTYISLTLLGGYVAIYDNNGVQQYYRNTNGTIELPYSANGTWSYKVGRYGYKMDSGTFTINRSVGGTVSIAPIYAQDIYVSDSVINVSAYNTFYKTQQIYDYLSYYRTTSAGLSAGDLNSYISTLDVGSKNIILFDAASPAFSYDGSTFTLNTLNLSGAAITTSGTISISGNSSISDITLTTDVLDQTPANLTNVNINGTLAYNTNSPATITYTDTTVDIVVNNGAGTVLIQRINSSINNATDPEIDDYAPTIINITPDGGSVAIYDNLNVRQYFITTTSTIVLPFDATGTWSYKVAKYGFHLIDQSFTINSSTGATITITPNYIPDNFIDALSANVANYTDLNNASEIHDYLMYFQTLSTGINFGDLESESFGTITFTNSLALSANASSMVSLSGNTTILNSTYLTDDITLVSTNGNITQHNGNTISDGIKLRANNLDSEIYFNTVDSITFYPNATDRDNNVNGNITLTSATIYRFKYGSTVSGITFTNYAYARVTVGGATLLVTTPIALGTNTIDFGVTGNLQTLNNNLRIVNTGVQKSSILVPHTTNI